MTSTPFSSHPGWGPLPRALVASRENYRRLRNGCLWLLLYVIASANHRTGKLTTTWGKIAEETGLSEQHLRSMGGHLRVKGYVGVHPQGNDMVLFVVHGWVPLNLRARLASEIRREELRENAPCREQPGTPPLAKEVARALGDDEHLEEIVDLVNTYPEQIIRSKLEAVAAVPSEKIRVSRFALWRYLLNQHAEQDDDT